MRFRYKSKKGNKNNTGGNAPKVFSGAIACRGISSLGWPFYSSLCPDIQIIRTNQLKHGVILNRPISLSNEFIPINQLGEEHFNLLECKVEPNTHALPRRKRSVGALVPSFHFVRVPAVRVKALRVVPVTWIVVDVVQGRDQDGFFGQFVATGQDEVGFCSTSRLE